MREAAKDMIDSLFEKLVNPVYEITKYFPNSGAYKTEIKLKRAQRIVDQVVATELDQLLEEYNGNAGKHPDRTEGSVMASLIANEPRFREGGTDSMLAEARVFVQAGFETTAHSLSFAMGMMAGRPHLADKIYKQGINTFNGGSYYSLDNMKKAIEKTTSVSHFFHESFCLYPPVPALGGECTSEIEITARNGSKYTLPKGTLTLFLNIPLQRQLEDEPNEIRLDRWEAQPKEQPFLHTFQNGPHTCPGKPLSLSEGRVFLLLAALQFTFEFPEDKCKVEYEDSGVLRPKTGCPSLLKEDTSRTRVNSSEVMDLKTSLIEDFPDATDAEVNRFIAAYSKNGKDVAGKRKAIETRLKNYLDWRQEHKLDWKRADVPSNDTSTWSFAVQRAWDIEDSLSEKDESTMTSNIDKQGDGDEVDSSTCIEHRHNIDQVVFFHNNETNGRTICDKNDKRIMHLLPARINPDWANARAYANIFAIYMDHNMDRDSTEKLTIVIDIRAGTGWSNKPVLKMMGILRAIISTFETNFCERVDKFVVFPVPGIARGIFNTIKVLFDPTTAKKVALISGPDGVDAPVPREDIEEHIDFEVVDYMEEARKNLFRHS